MLEKLNFIEDKYKELGEKVMDPDLLKDMKEYQKTMKEYSDLKPIVDRYKEYQGYLNELKDTEEMLGENLDDEMRELAKEDLKNLQENIAKAEEDLKIMLIPKDPNDDRNVIVEIRGGIGGEEAALFAGDLFRMYSMYADKRGYKTEVMSTNETGIGGFKEVIFMINGKGAYSRLKHESGVHRVQRVPETEASGRIHTSAATVAVMPEADDVEIEINENDLKIDVYRASGHGGQCVNTTDSAVRITHVPTGLVVTCQDEKSQLKNKEKAMKVLKSRLYDKMLQEQNDELAKLKKGQVGSGDRSERIRTYNFPQGRVTDHRINLTLYRLEDFLNGDLDEMIDALLTHEQAEKLKELEA
ncbi:MAG: peptide chain release factor 1 [Eubacteriales bacterium]|jgi:peptide chain release factor 1|uniref:peptide chain release factor 1 n=1 Tax=Fenollaria TaxID=1686313 RepID=UPI00071E22A9|nr:MULTISPECIES: peptide chain release factor 1 [Fenollaria]MDD7339146.1 peptide chain release factor 1 [Eubacteriales bacterium]MDY3105797.1 peptide chain release factor 1 [Fenollaria sp.]